MPRPKIGRDEFAYQYQHLLRQSTIKGGRWIEYRKDPRLKAVIDRAREELDYSPTTRDSEIFLSLRGACNTLNKKAA
jgi:hypothetical protein